LRAGARLGVASGLAAHSSNSSTRLDSCAVNTGLAASPTERAARRPITWLSGLAAPIAALALLLLVAGPVAAHAEFVSSDPADGAVLDTPPTSVTLTFSEGLNAARSKFQLLGPDGTLVGTGTAAADGDETMTLGGLELGPGDYLVKWTSVSLDTDILRGELRFTVNEASPTPAPTPTPAESAATAAPTVAPPTPTLEPVDASVSADPTVVPVNGDAASSSGGLGDALLPIVAVLVVVAVVGAYLVRRSRSA
jgi:copper resistance protein C